MSRVVALGVALVALAQWAPCAAASPAPQGSRSAARAAAPATDRTSDAARFSDPRSRVDRVLELTDARLSLMPGVAAWKWEHHAPVTDPARERVVIRAAVKLAAPLGLAPEPIERLFAFEVRLAREEETALYERWRRRGFDFHGRVPDLGKDLRPQLDRLTHDLLDALYLAAPVLARVGFPERYAPQAARALASAGWSDAGRRELLADLGQVRLTTAPALARIEASHLLRIGTTGDYAPFSAQSQGALRGVDIDLARDLATRLGARPVFVRTAWSTLLQDLNRNEFDVAVGGISDTPAREALAATSVAYLTGGKTIIAPCREASRFGSLSAVDKRGVRVIVNPGGTNEQYARTHLRRAQLRVHPDNSTIFDELAAGRADVMITDEVEVELQTHQHRGLCRAFPGTLTHEDKVILLARDPALTAAVNDWLRGELAAGLPQRLLRQALSSGGDR
ncbi:MAG TPA: transporter substrate-binding domain-containing protein [Steroidobacteraceae bacterium]|nr:transporter substrate-binding domain-containing protein [Steroidobacteraceae bacterium]